MKRICLTVLLLLAGAWAFGQEDTLRFSVRGAVRDAESGRPLQAVGVSVPGSRIAVVTNSDGSFIIKTPERVGELEFTLMGYRTVRQAVPADPSKVMYVRMTPGSLTLQAASVMSGDPRSIMLMAIHSISENSPGNPELHECFFRETVQKRLRYIYVSEAVTQVYKAPPREAFAIDRAAVVKSRTLASPRASDTLGVKVLGGPAMSVDLDLVKNRDLIIDEDYLDNYNLEMWVPEMIGDRMQFVIKFSPAVKKDIALYNGTAYIDRETLAFTRIELSLDMDDPALATRVMLVKKPAGLRFKPKEMSLVLNYSHDEGKTRLSYLRTRFRFNCDWRKRLFATDYTVVAEMVVTNRREGGREMQIPSGEAFGSRDALADKIAYYADPDFWSAYNIIEPGTSLEHAIGRLRK